jgi:hypothetical protein
MQTILKCADAGKAFASVDQLIKPVAQARVVFKYGHFD